MFPTKQDDLKRRNFARLLWWAMETHRIGGDVR